MSAQAGPGAEAPGAPSLGGQGLGAGMLAPGAANSPELRLEEQVLLTAEQLEQINNIAREAEEQLEEVKEELLERLERACSRFVKEIDYIVSDGIYHAEVVYAFDVYRYLTTGKDVAGYALDYLAKDVMENMSEEEINRRLKGFGEVQRRSIERVINACDREQKFVEFAPVEKDIELAITRARKKKHEDIVKLLERLKTMNVKEFFDVWEDVFEKLEKRGYDEVVEAIGYAMAIDNRFRNVMIDEMQKLAKELLGATEDEVYRLVMCLIEC